MAATERTRALDELADLAASSPRPAPVSPERAALAAAIGRRDEIQHRLDTVRSVREQNRVEISELHRQHTAALAAIEEAKTAAADNLVAAALGEKTVKGLSVREAQIAAETVQQALDIQTEAGALLEKREREIGHALAPRDIVVHGRAKDVLQRASAIPKLTVEFEALAQRLNDLRQVIGFLGIRANEFDPEWPTPRIHAWREAAKALEHDASVPLPES